ncbi:MAG: citrate:proton symporter [Alphaproteobacteria bacterium]|nr:citrate:proton symporter [Alphaproteobacteria bacterium]MBU1513934.1 citrate:proton symporter [Alphaproteobacteria bacterium]MBU2092634.1 citrate:proton symporter [Alphaproteobacteria bacterium]MBU2154245.1 citrate:proton symporter [Alphaproteobacteria bacterium]MBU2309509.1 citrate:proton symporter [Alphaproteobacteria bacterium]
MSLSLLGFAMVATFMTLIMTGRLAPLVALIVVPVLFGLFAGHGLDLGPMMLEGVKKIAPTGVMIMFAILYFGLMIDAGLFDPAVRRLLIVVRGDPVRIVMGTVILAVLVSLDGDGSTTYMVTVAAVLPLYRRLGLNPLIMACLIMLSSGVMNLTPWGGPTARAAAALQVEAGALFLPMVPAMAAAIAWLLALAWLYGRSERKRLGVLRLDGAPPDGGFDDLSLSADGEVTVSSDPAVRRPKLLLVNAALTIALLVTLVSGLVPLPVLFMAGFALATLINYPRPADLRARIAMHAPNAIAMVALIFAAGVFTGVLSGTGMAEAMPRSLLALVPPSMGPWMASITAALSLPMTFFVSNDAFYFGVLPVLAEAGGRFGISREAIGAASLIGQPFHLLSPLVPSTYLLVSLANIEFGDHQKFTVKWALATCAVLFAAGALTGVFPVVA